MGNANKTAGYVVKFAAPAPMRGTITRCNPLTGKPYVSRARAERAAKACGGRVYEVKS